MKPFQLSALSFGLLGAVVFSPLPLRAQRAPAGATAKCEDGTYSKAKNRTGACSDHGGVATWLERTPTARRAPEGATARCEDGTYSEAANEQGACSQHGGVARWLGNAEDRGPRVRDSESERSPTEVVPGGVTARCQDGSYTTTSTRQGACSQHGGVVSWVEPSRDRGAARSSARARQSNEKMTTNRDQATARCVDGTYSMSRHRSGTCSFHGGVKEWLRDDIPNE